MKTYPVIEVFGPTVQGEGALAGQRSHFVRFAYCDFKCAWCDSAPAVVPKLIREAKVSRTASEIVSTVRNLGDSTTTAWVTLTGGNPAIHDLTDLVAQLHAADYKVAVETQGTLAPPWLRDCDLVTVSPKPPSAKQPPIDLTIFFEALTVHRGKRNEVIKVVVFDGADLAYAVRVHEDFPLYPFYLSVGTEMGGLDGTFGGGHIDTTDDIAARYRWLVEASLDIPALRDATIYPQLHVIAWGHERGH